MNLIFGQILFGYDDDWKRNCSHQVEVFVGMKYKYLNTEITIHIYTNKDSIFKIQIIMWRQLRETAVAGWRSLWDKYLNTEIQKYIYTNKKYK